MNYLYKRIYAELTNRAFKLSKLEQRIQKEMSPSSPDTLIVRGKPDYPCYYLHRSDGDGAKDIYISVKNTDIVRKMIQNDYQVRLQKRVNYELKTLQHFLPKLKHLIDHSPEDLYDHAPPGRKKHISPYLLGPEATIEKWMNEPFTPLQYPGAPSGYVTEKGETVRSKSELLIASYLYKMQIPYKYEKPLSLAGTGTVHPDFTIIDPHTLREVYIEHMGMMDNDDYRANALRKLESYILNGYLPGESLIVFFESDRLPLNTRTLEAMLRRFAP
ncbi:MAG: hypothetical protein HUJ69_07500 [Lachnospiraceae bacterium]|nr:hypothetical protein [Lachnospiraceae bacterium]